MPTLIPKDTSFESARFYFAQLAKMTDQERLKRTVELMQFSRDMIKASISHRFPEADEAELERLHARQVLEPSLYRQMYGVSR